MVRVRNFCSQLYRRSMHMRVTKNTLRQEKLTVKLCRTSEVKLLDWLKLTVSSQKF